MTVKELIAQLEKLPQNAPVAVSKDGEGNGFTLLYELTTERMEPTQGYGQLEPSGRGKHHIVLWPMG